MKLYSRAFLVYASERAIKTVAQAALALLIAGQSSIVSVDWAHVGEVSALAGLVSLLTSVAVVTGAQPVDPPAQSVANTHAVPATPAVDLDATQVIPVVPAE